MSLYWVLDLRIYCNNITIYDWTWLNSNYLYLLGIHLPSKQANERKHQYIQRHSSAYQVFRKVNEHLPWHSVKVKEVWVFGNSQRHFSWSSPLSFLCQQQLFLLCEGLWKALRLVRESFCGSSPTFLPPLNSSVESQFASPRLQFLLFIVWKWVCIKMKRNHILICLELGWMW